MTVGQRLQKARKRLDLSQSQMAERIGVAQPSITNWERDEHLPDVKIWAKVAEAYGLKVTIFLPRAA